MEATQHVESDVFRDLAQRGVSFFLVLAGGLRDLGCCSYVQTSQWGEENQVLPRRGRQFYLIYFTCSVSMQGLLKFFLLGSLS